MRQYSYDTLIKIIKTLKVDLTQKEVMEVARKLGYKLTRQGISRKKSRGLGDIGHTRLGGSQAVFYTIEDMHKILKTYNPNIAHKAIVDAVHDVTGLDKRYIRIKQDKLK